MASRFYNCGVLVQNNGVCGGKNLVMVQNLMVTLDLLSVAAVLVAGQAISNAGPRNAMGERQNPAHNDMILTYSKLAANKGSMPIG